MSLMWQSIRFLLIGILLTALPSAILAQANPFQGIYAGRLLVRASSRGYQPDYYPSRMTVLPDGHSIFITTQLSNSVATSVIRGSFKGNLFEGSSAGRLNVRVYTGAGTCKITFIRNEARIETNSAHLPPGYVHDPREDKPQIFYRIRS
jgi:hypothetical protein